MSLDTSYFSRAAADASVVGDRVILFERRSRTTVVLNPTGTTLWNFMAQPCTFKALCDHLRSCFPTLSSEQAGRDVQAYVDELLKHQLILPSST